MTLSSDEARAPLLEMIEIEKRFGGTVACNRVSIAVEHGEVRGLLGENGAGKSTLMHVLYGMVQPDAGEIRIDGKPVRIASPRDAIAYGIGMVHQHFMLVPTMTVTENVILGLGQEREPLLDLAGARARIRELSNRYGLLLDPDAVVGNLSVGMQQRLEILKLLYRDVRVLILDEPTAVITPPEWELLSRVLAELAATGRAIVFITHKLRELFGLAKRCTVLRDGSHVATVALSDVDEHELARLMVGRELAIKVQRQPTTPGRVVLDVRAVSLTRADGRRLLDEVSFDIKEHEVLGIAGVEGNGQHELAEVLCGVTAPSSGSIAIRGHTAAQLEPRALSDASVAVITDDRLKTGLVGEATVVENLLLKDFRHAPFKNGPIVSRARMGSHAATLAREYDVRTRDLALNVGRLSGGNQQKVVLARELSREPNLIVASQPTRGLDVAAMHFVWERLLEERARRCAILLISTELEEIFTLSDRIAVMVAGRIVRVLEAAEANAELLGLLMAGHMAPSPPAAADKT